MKRTVSIEQVARGIEPNCSVLDVAYIAISIMPEKSVQISARQIADATGGDVFEPINALEAGLAEGARRAGLKQITIDVRD